MHGNQQISLAHTSSSSHDKARADFPPPFLNADGRLDFAPGDSENPSNWSTKRKCYITAVAILLVVNATFASSAPTGAFQGITKDLDVSNEVTGLVTTLFLLGYCTGPLIWAPASERWG
jgi:DHA1 family multidrug resistance protein-like MFS transporter